MKLIFVALCAVLLTNCSAPSEQVVGSRALSIVEELHNAKSKNVLVVAHRGDWRNYPENSLEGFQSAINMGVDIIELDIQMTLDSVLVVCHDPKINRTTTGRGWIQEITADSIRRCYLKTGHDVATTYKMPTLREALMLCKGQVVVNIDKGYAYYQEVLRLTEELGVTEEVLIKGKRPIQEVAEEFALHPRNLMYMPIIDIEKPHGKALFDSYMAQRIHPLAFEVCWQSLSEDVKNGMRQIKNSSSKLWVNSLWASLNGGLSDDEAYPNHANEIYGSLVDMGATIIQTDRPEFLINYLRQRGLHN